MTRLSLPETAALRAGPLSAGSFAPFGTLLGQPGGAPSLERGDITFWNATADLSGLSGSGVTGHLIAHRRPNLLTQIERHQHTPEAFICLGGRSLFVAGPPGEPRPGQPAAVRTGRRTGAAAAPGHLALGPLSAHRDGYLPAGAAGRNFRPRHRVGRRAAAPARTGERRRLEPLAALTPPSGPRPFRPPPPSSPPLNTGVPPCRRPRSPRSP